MSERIDVQNRIEVRDWLLRAVEQSVTSASGSGRTVEDPRKAAEYVVNMLTVHRTDLLDLAAATFSRAPTPGVEESPE